MIDENKMLTTQKLLVVVSVPPEGVMPVLNAIAEAGGGEIGHYTHCAFTSVGEGYFKPQAEADPYSGTKGQVNHEPEVRIESFCLRPQARAVVSAIRAAHPYEQPVIYLIPMLNEADL